MSICWQNGKPTCLAMIYKKKEASKVCKRVRLSLKEGTKIKFIVFNFIEIILKAIILNKFI